MNSHRFFAQPYVRMVLFAWILPASMLIQDSLGGIPNFVCPTKKVALAGQPESTSYAAIAAAGYKRVINLRTATEGVDLEAERKAVTAAGLDYVGIPVRGAEPTEANVEEFVAAMRDKKFQPVFIHCASGNRAAALWAIHQVVNEGWDPAKALAEAEKAGLTSPKLKQFVSGYFAAHPAKH